MDILLLFAERLQELILDEQTSPEIVSAELNHNVFDFYHWTSKTNKYMPTVANLIKLGDYFNCSIEFLIGLSDENSIVEPNSILPNFAVRFLDVVKEKETNLHKLGLATQTSTTTYYRWINNKAVPTIDSLIKVSKALDCSIDYILGREK